MISGLKDKRFINDSEIGLRFNKIWMNSHGHRKNILNIRFLK